MKRIMTVSLLIFFVASCQKGPTISPQQPEPAMRYVNLADTAIRMHRAAQFDINGDGEWDVFFGTLLVGDPLAQVDKHQWLVASSFNTNLPVNNSERIPMLQKDHPIPISDFSGYNWFNASMVCLTQKIVGMTAPPFWDGEWKNANHHYIPIQVMKNGGLFNGWVEASFNPVEEKLIIHKAAISKEAGKIIKAGK